VVAAEAPCSVHGTSGGWGWGERGWGLVMHGGPRAPCMHDDFLSRTRHGGGGEGCLRPHGCACGAEGKGEGGASNVRRQSPPTELEVGHGTGVRRVAAAPMQHVQGLHKPRSDQQGGLPTTQQLGLQQRWVERWAGGTRSVRAPPPPAPGPPSIPFAPRLCAGARWRFPGCSPLHQTGRQCTGRTARPST
jgi:hypothetical protein